MLLMPSWDSLNYFRGDAKVGYMIKTPGLNGIEDYYVETDNPMIKLGLTLLLPCGPRHSGLSLN